MASAALDGSSPGGLPPLSASLAWPRRGPGQRRGTQLSQQDLQWVYDHLTEPAVDFDCGQRCRGNNEGIPFCCDKDVAVPVVYRPELAFLQKRTGIWSRWQPLTFVDRRMDAELDGSNIHVVCKGVQHCERDNRSISCRIFPYYPFTDRQGTILGLVYNQILKRDCWLHDKHRQVSAAFVEQNLAFWHFLFDRLPEEVVLFTETSSALRRYHSQFAIPLRVLRPEGVFEAPYRDGEGPLRRVGPLQSYRLGSADALVPAGPAATGAAATGGTA